jgi:uncharacterized phage protein (TIGR01671 family)
MKREFKFRVWDIKNKSWVDDTCGIDIVDGRLFQNVANHLPYEDMDNFIIQQFTGLKDKNGKEIYEGDIVIFDTFNCLIEFDYGQFWIKQVKGLRFDIYLRDKKIEVIGNIFENPDLLKTS